MGLPSARSAVWRACCVWPQQLSRHELLPPLAGGVAAFRRPPPTSARPAPLLLAGPDGDATKPSGDPWADAAIAPAARG